jgi:hypothetical protein
MPKNHLKQNIYIYYSKSFSFYVLGNMNDLKSNFQSMQTDNSFMKYSFCEFPHKY